MTFAESMKARLSQPCTGEGCDRFAVYSIGGKLVCNVHAPRGHTARALDD